MHFERIQETCLNGRFAENVFKRISANSNPNNNLKGVLNPNYRPFSFKMKKFRFFTINFNLGFRVL